MRAVVELLLALRCAHGLSVARVDVTDLFDDFAFGQRMPYAIRGFLGEIG
jgi:hypothetical protein